ncbi:MAG: bifunctional oligoribonuclease/PAP phosphatase NrnA [Clostridia bacterium]|nr:bifunctional oligoribonuclease/PAP phosphatase NrnA [Clostridia bacterium]
MEILQQIYDKIEQYDRIMLFRHLRNDGDCVGATKGLKAIIKLTWPEKEVYLIDEDHAEYLAFLGEDDAPVEDALYADALGIVLDTGNTGRISNPKYTLCRELIKIDHHIDVNPYGDLSWVEEEASSACEMVAKFYFTFKDKLKIDREAATYLYTGMVTDSGRFRFSSTSGDTLRMAGMLLDLGIDTEILYANLYLQDTESFKFKSYVYKNMKMTPAGVAYLYVSRATMEKYGLTHEQAAAAVSLMDSIKGSLIWLIFIEHETEIRVRLRSRFVTVNQIAERYNGGGHACASGATVRNKRQAMTLVAEADQTLAKYKTENEGWL